MFGPNGLTQFFSFYFSVELLMAVKNTKFTHFWKKLTSLDSINPEIFLGIFIAFLFLFKFDFFWIRAVLTGPYHYRAAVVKTVTAVTAAGLVKNPAYSRFCILVASGCASSHSFYGFLPRCTIVRIDRSIIL
jgi:hypothetical protein